MLKSTATHDMLGSQIIVGDPANDADAGRVNVGVAVTLPPVPNVYLVRMYMILLTIEY